MRVSIITPCFNAETMIADAVASICRQTFLKDDRNSVQYIVVDGGSADGTMAAARSAWVETENASIAIISEPDSGMYDALRKGLSLADGSAVAYLNAGDYYSDHCLSVVQTCFEAFDADWLTGMRVTYARDGSLISAKTPWTYDRALILNGYYGVKGKGRFIQQESTFWRASLLSAADLDRLGRLRLAGDFFLWATLASRAELTTVAAHLGGFRFHGDHLSDAMTEYRREARLIVGSGRLDGYLRAPMHEMLSWVPVPLRGLLPFRRKIIAWDAGTADWVWI